MFLREIRLLPARAGIMHIVLPVAVLLKLEPGEIACKDVINLFNIVLQVLSGNPRLSVVLLS